MNDVSLLGAIVIGILAGWIAEQVMGRRQGLLTNLVVGVIGAFMGAFIADTMDIRYGGFVGSLVISTLGAVVVLLLAGLFGGRRRPLH